MSDLEKPAGQDPLGEQVKRTKKSKDEAAKSTNQERHQPENLSSGGVKRWYAVQTYSGSEMFVQRSLLERVRQNHLEDMFEEVLVPTEEVVEMRAGQKRRSERKFFPGYVLIRMEMNDQTWQLVRALPKVLGFIGGRRDGRPTPISDAEANVILNRIQEGVEKPKPKILFEVGEVVRVTEGPFADFNGVVEEVNYEKNRLRVAVLIFGRSTPVELEFGQVEKG